MTTEKPTPLVDRAAQATREVLFEPYNPARPTLSDKAAKFASEVFHPDLTPEQRAENINQTKPWLKGGFMAMMLWDGHPLLAALPFIFRRPPPPAPLRGEVLTDEQFRANLQRSRAGRLTLLHQLRSLFK